MDVSAIPVLKKLTHLPVFGDPSHGVGIRDLVPPMALASIAAGADGLLMEMHPNPEKAMSDGAQSLFPDQLEQLMRKLRRLAPVVGRTIAENVAALRK
jgi:3-deoxy-7-phosphoheptulonate synthase